MTTEERPTATWQPDPATSQANRDAFLQGLLKLGLHRLDAESAADLFVAVVGKTTTASYSCEEDDPVLPPQQLRNVRELKCFTAEGLAAHDAEVRRDLEATIARVRELVEVYADGHTVGLIRYAVVKQLRIALDGDA